MSNLVNPQIVKNTLWLIPALPLTGAVINGLLRRRLPERLIHFIGCASVFIAFVVSLVGFFTLIQIEAPHDRLLIQSLYQWLLTVWDPGRFSLEVAFRLDPLSAVLCLVVTGVGFLIHLYSVGYMSGDESQGRYFAYLNLFTFSMLLLVLADNLLLMFVGWEGVGLCSYLLIGFWFSDLEKAQAGMKAFIVNRVGDFGFFVGLMLLFWSLFEGSGASVTGLDFNQLKEAIPLLGSASPTLGVGVATWVALLFFVGATGKSAQIPLYIWLPDAMAGPTPVSAFIHAATMVTAGVYMIVRLNFLYLVAPVAMTVVAVVGAATAFYAATIALVQNDIKRVLAYSTISQLGYMFLAVGVGAFSTGIFHLVTHAFFKALLFLGAGSVIHAVHSNDMQEMGGLRKYMPHTYLTFMAAYLAISGIPPLSGFVSKDEILWATFNSHLSIPGLGKALWALGLLGAGLTAFLYDSIGRTHLYGCLPGWGRQRGASARITAGNDCSAHGFGCAVSGGWSNRPSGTNSFAQPPSRLPWTGARQSWGLGQPGSRLWFRGSLDAGIHRGSEHGHLCRVALLCETARVAGLDGSPFPRNLSGASQ